MHPHHHGRHGKAGDGEAEIRLLAWEVTRTCNLSCVHCRAAALDKPYPNELSTEECLRLLDDVRSFASPIIILTGGEPLLRPDIFEIASSGTAKGLRMVLATNGTGETGWRAVVRATALTSLLLFTAAFTAAMYTTTPV